MAMNEGTSRLGAGPPAEPDARELPRAPQLSALGHDLRSLLAAATTNLEFVRVSEGLEGEPADILAEVDHELRLAADVIEFVTSSRSLDRVSAVDLRAAFWLARRAGGRVVVDAAAEPYPVRASVAPLLAWISALSMECPDQAGAHLVREGDELRISPVQLESAARFVDDPRAETHGITLELRGDALFLRARG
jgi:hypothetical protein